MNVNPKRTPLIAGNWKLNLGGAAAACSLASEIAEAAASLPKVEVVVSPPYTALAAVAQKLDGSKVEVSGQNLYPKDSGAFTGEISAAMLLEAGCRWVILGHSERRQYFAESDEFVRQKVAAAMAAGLKPILCVGETLEEREAGNTLAVVFRQLDAVVGELNKQPGFGVVAYEPVWAIGTGKVAGPEQAQEVHAAIRQRLAGVSQNLADVTRILYGGSVKADNAAGLLGCADIDGALVGGAALKASEFIGIMRAAQG
jgi:triosephosphate isomerase